MIFQYHRLITHRANCDSGLPDSNLFFNNIVCLQINIIQGKKVITYRSWEKVIKEIIQTSSVFKFV